jgi:hypothetical protein
VAEIKRKLSLGNREVEVTELDIVKRSGEGLAEYILEDGSVIRVANVAAVVYRMDGQSDGEGNPLYIVKLGTSVTTVKAQKSNLSQGGKIGGSST